MNNNLSGKISELLARSMFRLKGYKILAKNYVTGKGTHAGEVDFIALRGRTLVFVEVKKRTSIEAAAFAISANQQQRVSKGAEAFLKRFPKYAEYNVRFDAVLVKFPFTVVHIVNAW